MGGKDSQTQDVSHMHGLCLEGETKQAIPCDCQGERDPRAGAGGPFKSTELCMLFITYLNFLKIRKERREVFVHDFGYLSRHIVWF